MNKSLLTNIISFILIPVGIYFNQPIVLTVGLFAFSGSVTNWLAVHMLFERIPLLYGSGVIPARFEEFKAAIKAMMMDEFFSDENIDKFLSHESGIQPDLHLKPVIEKLDLTPAFDRLVMVIMQSSFGSMLNMFGGQEALTPLKAPFIENMKISMVEITEQEEFADMLKDEIEQPEVMNEIKDKIAVIIDNRLAELTPQLVKQIVQNMIKTHLGWLVVWGGVFGGIIGLLSSIIFK